MPDVFITLEEAAAFESVSYKTLTQRIYRNPQQYKTKSQAREGGGKDQVLISTSSLSAKARKAWRAAQKVEGSEVIIDKRAQEAVPWYVTADLNQYTEANKKRFYEAVELAARVQGALDRKPEKKVDLGGGKKDKDESSDEGGSGKGKQVIIHKLLVPVDLKKIKDLQQLLALLQEVEDYAAANEDGEPGDDEDAVPAPA